jgi:hypothetical protein
VNVASDTAPWLAEFTIAEGAFNSGDFVCPNVNFCNPNDTPAVSIVANITPANASNVVVVQWKYQPIDPPGTLIYSNTELVNTAGQEVADSIDLDEGLYTCTLEIITPVLCLGPPAAFTVDPLLAPDGTPSEACPGINFDDINVGNYTNADEHTVTVNAVVTPTAGTVVEADTALSSGDVLGSARRQALEINLSGNRDLPPGDYTTYFRITSHGCCTPPGVDIVVATCPSDDDTTPAVAEMTAAPEPAMTTMSQKLAGKPPIGA